MNARTRLLDAGLCRLDGCTCRLHADTGWLNIDTFPLDARIRWLNPGVAGLPREAAE